MLRNFHKALGKIEAVVAAAFLIVMVGLIFYGGVARLLARPQNWTIDLSTCLFAWACFLCADIAWRRDSLMSITLVSERLPKGAQRVLMQANYAIIAVFLIYVMYAGTWLSWISRARAFQGIPEVSYSWVTMSLPVGAALLLLTTAIKAADELAGSRRSAPAGDGER
jgi:TRAP-type C4-dicarboxylate transport system permease small subunit